MVLMPVLQLPLEETDDLGEDGTQGQAVWVPLAGKGRCYEKDLDSELIAHCFAALAVVLGSVIGSSGPGDFLPVLVGDEHWLWAGACHVGSCYFAAYLGLSIRVNVAQAILLLAAILGYTRIHVKE